MKDVKASQHLGHERRHLYLLACRSHEAALEAFHSSVSCSRFLHLVCVCLHMLTE